MICNVRWVQDEDGSDALLNCLFLVVLNTRRGIAPILFARFHCRLASGSFLQNGHSAVT